MKFKLKIKSAQYKKLVYKKKEYYHFKKQDIILKILNYIVILTTQGE